MVLANEYGPLKLQFQSLGIQHFFIDIFAIQLCILENVKTIILIKNGPNIILNVLLTFVFNILFHLGHLDKLSQLLVNFNAIFAYLDRVDLHDFAAAPMAVVVVEKRIKSGHFFFQKGVV